MNFNEYCFNNGPLKRIPMVLRRTNSNNPSKTITVLERIYNILNVLF